MPLRIPVLTRISRTRSVTSSKVGRVSDWIVKVSWMTVIGLSPDRFRVRMIPGFTHRPDHFVHHREWIRSFDNAAGRTAALGAASDNLVNIPAVADPRAVQHANL